MPHSATVKPIDVDKIDIEEHINVRRRNIYEGLEELAQSIKLYGLQNPIVVAPVDGRFKLVSGQRRLLAVRDNLKEKQIRASILDEPISDIEARVLSLTENLVRRDLDPRDTGVVCDYLYQKYGSIKAVAENLGLSQSTVRKYISYQNLVPEKVKREVETEEAGKRLTTSDAKKIAQIIPDEEKQVRIAKRLKQIVERPAKDRVFEAMEYEPHASVDEIFEHAKRLQSRIKITLEFSERLSLGLKTASSDMEKEVETIIKDIVTDWLERNGYVRQN